jgi:hypothetical protein
MASSVTLAPGVVLMRGTPAPIPGADRDMVYDQMSASERMRLVCCWSPPVSALTVLLAVLIPLGGLLAATSRGECPSGCFLPNGSGCAASFPCDCPSGSTAITCAALQLDDQAEAGLVLLGIGLCGVLIQALILCGCCGAWPVSCCLSSRPPTTRV